ncbi:MAG: twitching motility protein PilT [Gallionellales bacterium RIFCSPLOWO2_12_FULL_59_22]|nr:MAG: twitching motility protein PilT [Gallionellales bacterium RIFCSPLOWO2_02_FULL_59_110]OGT05036.1 MAG: twitching motility protein PilT [Gallionellales bacterium RIFCSPLOWO2_02_58_13]OGT12532.1 MAG: twitching motility protein PilT [Gallionellales bacterium RIFCSPLOWO2_12_FULL_59_22]
MNVVDSCGWLEYFADGQNAAFFAPVIEDTASLIVPTVSLFEVFKRILQQRTENDALRAVALMQQGRVVVLDDALALSAAKISFDLKLPMADSLILATARAHAAVLWTQDNDFAGIQGVQYIQKYS